MRSMPQALVGTHREVTEVSKVPGFLLKGYESIGVRACQGTNIVYPYPWVGSCVSLGFLLARH